MPIFLLIWLGQIVSLLGSSLSEFALGVWVYQSTGSITQFALISVCIHLPNLLISPLAGAIVDRCSRRWAMVLSDSVAGIGTLVIMALVFSDRLEVWHIYIAVGFSSFFNAFQWPAYIASIAQLVPKQHLSRANGMVQVSRAIAKISGPTIAGVLISIIHIEGILLVDFSTFLFALITLLCVRFPKLEQTQPQSRILKPNQLWQDTLSGWHYIVARPGLLKLMLFFVVTYFSEGILQVLFWPLVLSFASSQELGLVLSVSGFGLLFGSLAVSIWGGPKRRVYAILVFVCVQGACLCMGGLKPSVFLAGLGGFGYLFARPFIVSYNQSIWQCKVPMDLQGRVFALQSVVERSLLITAHLSIGPLVDQIFEPLLAPNGLLADSVGKLIGVGTGRGMGFLLMLLGISNIVMAIIAYRTPGLRRVEKELPDVLPSNAVSSS